MSNATTTNVNLTKKDADPITLTEIAATRRSPN